MAHRSVSMSYAIVSTMDDSRVDIGLGSAYRLGEGKAFGQLGGKG